MLFESQFKGKVIINIQKEDDAISSHIVRKGIARDDRTAIGAVLASYISMCDKAGKDPVKLLEDNRSQLSRIIKDRK